MLRNRKRAVQAVKQLDAFPKTSEECLETTTTGGTLSLVSFAIMVWLIIWECTYYLETKFTFKFEADVNFKEKLQINMDVTVAMPCSTVGADVLDVTGQHVMTYGELSMEDTWFELDPDQLVHFQGIQRANNYLREEFHSIHEVLWRSGYINLFGGIPERKRFPSGKMDACRISGSMNLNKVAGNLHITAGKSIPLPQGHAHIAVFMEERDYNFSHRITKLSFGDPAPGIIHPLEGDEQIAGTHMFNYQYFITVVPTTVNTYKHFGNSFQYSVTEQAREISHAKGSHGSVGIFFKYDVSALKIDVREEHEPFLQFLTRLVGIIGGVFTCSGLIHRFMGVIVNCLFCRYLRSTPPEASGVKYLKTRSISASTPSLISNPSPSPTLKTPLLAPPPVSASIGNVSFPKKVAPPPISASIGNVSLPKKVAPPPISASIGNVSLSKKAMFNENSSSTTSNLPNQNGLLLPTFDDSSNKR